MARRPDRPGPGPNGGGPVSSEVWFTLLVAAVGLERIAELVVSTRNAAWSMRRGGRETGQRHYAVMVVLHTGLLVGALAEVWLRRPDVIPALAATMLALVVASQGLRWWCIGTLGRRWNTRVIVVPGLPPVTGGPYRWFSHPNYVAVVVEGFALPLVHTAWVTALVFTACNAALLAVRIRVENAALATLPPPTAPPVAG
jgi:methyltransferase